MASGNVQMISLVDHNVNSNVKKVTKKLTEEKENANAKITRVSWTSGYTSGFEIRLKSFIINRLKSKVIYFELNFKSFGCILTTSGH